MNIYELTYTEDILYLNDNEYQADWFIEIEAKGGGYDAPDTPYWDRSDEPTLTFYSGRVTYTLKDGTKKTLKVTPVMFKENFAHREETLLSSIYEVDRELAEAGPEYNPEEDL